MKKIFCLLLLSGCTGKDILVQGNYYLVTVDTPQEVSLSYRYKNPEVYVDVVSPNVIALSSNKNFIIIKRALGNLVDEKSHKGVEYYIIPIEKPVSKFPDLNKIGPLSKGEFVRYKKKLIIPDSLNFVSNFD